MQLRAKGPVNIRLFAPKIFSTSHGAPAKIWRFEANWCRDMFAGAQSAVPEYHSGVTTPRRHVSPEGRIPTAHLEFSSLRGHPRLVVQPYKTTWGAGSGERMECLRTSRKLWCFCGLYADRFAIECLLSEVFGLAMNHRHWGISLPAMGRMRFGLEGERQTSLRRAVESTFENVRGRDTSRTLGESHHCVA